MSLACGCPDEKGCFHQPCSLGRLLGRSQKRIIQNAYGYIRLVDPQQLVLHLDGRVRVRQ